MSGSGNPCSRFDIGSVRGEASPSGITKPRSDPDAASVKEELRKNIRKLRSLMKPQETAERSRRICRKLIAHERVTQARELLVYSAIGNEVDLRELVDWALTEGRVVAFPRCEGDSMDFFPVSDRSELTRVGSFHILEPEGKLPLIPGMQTVMLAPGVVFSPRGARIGMGRGYYDRYLQRYPDVYRIGVCYSFQVRDGWTSDVCDVPMEEIITEDLNSEIRNSSLLCDQ